MRSLACLILVAVACSKSADPKAESKASIATIPMPTVPDVGLAPLGEDPALTITPNAIVVEGTSIVAVKNGDVDPSEKEGGALGINIPRLAQYMKTLVELIAKQKPGGPPVTLILLVDPATPYKLLMEVMFSVKSAPIRTFALAVHAGTATKAIPIVLHGQRRSDDTGTALEPIVSITKTHILLWSISGQEGALDKPKLDVPLDRVGDVQEALAEIAGRRWPGGKDKETVIIVQADGGVPVQKVAEVMAAVRQTFPDLRLSSGFE